MLRAKEELHWGLGPHWQLRQDAIEVMYVSLLLHAGINWMKHLNELGVSYYLVGATDKQTAVFLSGQGNHPCFKFFEDGAEEVMKKEYK